MFKRNALSLAVALACAFPAMAQDVPANANQSNAGQSAAGDYMCVHTHSETHVMRTRLKSLINERLPDVFVRIHKSTVVNLNYIVKMQPLCNSEYNAVLVNSKVLKVSRTYARTIKERLSL